jgi:iron complex outermembrane recepter protein
MRRTSLFVPLQNNTYTTIFRQPVICLFMLLCLFSPMQLLAADNQTSLDEIIVTASRFDEKLTTVPAHVTVIDENRIRNSTAKNIPDLLRTEAGVQVTDTLGNQRYFSVDLRGFGETGLLNTLVLVDGRRVNNVDLSGTDWSQISLDRVQRIEIIRGGRGSILYGDNASGGVINIITKESSNLSAGGEASAGSYATYRASTYISGSPLNVLPIYASGSYMQSNGYRHNSYQDAKDFGINFSYLGIRDLKINISSGYHKDLNKLPGALKESDFTAGIKRTDTLHPHDKDSIEDYYFMMTPEYFAGNDITLKLDTSYRKRTLARFSDGEYTGGRWDYTSVSGLQTVAMSPRATIKNEINKWMSNNLIVGADYTWSSSDMRTVSEDTFAGITNGFDRLRKTNYGSYIYDEISLFKRLYLSGGYRWDQANYTFSPEEPHSRVMVNHVWTAGLNYKYLNKSYAYMSYSKSFRNPVLDEFYGYSIDPVTWAMTTYIKTSLKKQTSDSYEIGTRFYFTDDIYAHVNLFRIDTRDEIFLNLYTQTNENIDGMTRRKGLEFSLSTKVTKEILLRGSYTYTDAEITAGEFAKKEVPNVPEHKATIEGQYSPFNGFTVALNGTYVGERRFISDFKNEFLMQKSYYLVNNKYSYRWKNCTLFVNINNLLNQKYSEFGVLSSSTPREKAYYPSPRINFTGGIRFEL